MKEFMGSGYLHIALCIVSSVILIVGFFAWAFYLIKYVTRPKESNLQKLYGRKRESLVKEKTTVIRLVVEGIFLGIYVVLYFLFI